MLTKYDLGQMVDPEDKRLLANLLTRHRHADDLLHDEISGFRVAREQLTGHRRFEIVRPDGSVNDFSYLKCISPPKNRHFVDVIWAMRCDVIEQTRSFHDAAFKGNSTVRCGITGLPIKRKGSHVDHAPPLTFQVLAFNFLKEVGLRIEEVAVTAVGRLNTCAAKYLADRDLALKWQEYHQSHADLRITSKAANLAQGKIRVDFSGLE
jgi:hypothetical protein